VRKLNIYWTEISRGTDRMILAATDNGLCYAGGWNRPADEMLSRIRTRFGNEAIERSDDAMGHYAGQFLAYFAGALHHFSLPLDLGGTPFQRSVWAILEKIPYGRTMTYSDIAHWLNRHTAQRAVGAAIGANPALVAVPCHRVIGKSGELTGYRGGLAMKRELLAMETGTISRLFPLTK
jgi:methylated-DNA-[protein]-cysteine S-methyltransferase